MNEQPTLFELGDRDPQRTRVGKILRPAPCRMESPGSRAGAAFVERHGRRRTVAAWIIWLLARAGPVTHAGQRGGCTIEELAELVSRYRAKPTSVATICGRIAGERAELAEWVRKSGYLRRGRAGTSVDVYVHRDYFLPRSVCVASQGAALEA